MAAIQRKRVRFFLFCFAVYVSFESKLACGQAQTVLSNNDTLAKLRKSGKGLLVKGQPFHDGRYCLKIAEK